MASEGQTLGDRRMSAVGAGRAVLPRRRTRRVVAVSKKKIVEDEFMAAAIGDVKWLEQSLRDGRSTTAMDKNGLATIHLAALHGRLECLKLLVEKYKVDVDFPSSTGWRAVHLVINKETGKRAHKCLQYLLEKGADPSAMNDDSLTPVHQAASEGLVDCLQLLIDCRGVVDVIDVRGHRPIDLAKLWGHRKCARMLASVMWSQEKEFFAKEMRQLGQVTAKYWDFERDTAETKRAEQDFYGQVAFGNWIDDKGLPAKLKQIDFLSRPEQFPAKPSTTKSKTSTRSGEGTTTGSGLYRPNSKLAAPTVSSVKKEDVLRGIQTTTQKFPVREHGLRPLTQPPPEIVEHPASPSKSPDSPRKDMKANHTKEWKQFFTNIESEPKTDIFRPHEVRRSVEPEDNNPFEGLRRTKSQPITSHLGYDLKEIERPVTSGGLRMPVLPEEVIRRGLSRQRLPHERIKMPQEFKCVNIIDVQQKRLPDPEVRQGEAAMHLAQTLESNLFQLAVGDNACRMSTGNSSTATSSTDIQYSRERVMNTMKRLEKPKPFPAMPGPDYVLNLSGTMGDRLANRSGTLQTRPGPRGNHGTRNIDNSLPSLQNRLHKYRLPQPAPRYGEIGVPRDTPGLGLTTDHPASGFAVINDSTELLVRTQEPDGLPPSTEVSPKIRSGKLKHIVDIRARPTPQGSPPDCGQDVPCDSGSRIDTRWPPRAVSPAQISQQ
ncbi:Ankyrin repeat domain-containing protein 53 [Branchiostoma belcheri]|nr:Ankyrin repeat domain-containing protein 53 [Branchiostoma belcheri]